MQLRLAKPESPYKIPGKGNLKDEDSGNAVAELRVERLVVPNADAQQRPDAAAEGRQPQKRRFRNAPFAALSLQFINAVHKKRKDIDHKQKIKKIFQFEN